MERIYTLEALEAWLKNRSAWWSAAIAQRVVLRSIASACALEDGRQSHYHPSSAITLFRIHSISAVAATFPTKQISNASSRAALGHFPGDASTRVAYATADAAAYAAYPANAAADTADATRTAAFYDNSDAFWDAINTDLVVLEHAKGGDSRDAIILLSTPLWSNGLEGHVTKALAKARSTLASDGFPLWSDWYDRRIVGRATGFALPPEQDLELHQRLIAQDNVWWEREPALVNADIQAWIDELTPDPVAAALETAQVRLEMGIEPDFDRPEAQSALQALRSQISELEAKLAEAHAEIERLLEGHGLMGHNRPDEPLDDPVAVANSQDLDDTRATIAALEAQLSTLKAQLAQPKPELSRLIRIASKLRAFGVAMMGEKASGSFADEIGKELAKGIGGLVKWGLPATAGVVIALPKLIDALVKWLQIVLP